MTSKGHALSREALIRTLTAYSGITTEDGAADGTTLIDSALIDRNDFISGKTILLMNGDAKDEDKGALSFDNSDGKITLRGTGVSAQIKAGTVFRILNISSIEIDVAVIQDTLGLLTTAAATGSPTDIDPLMAYVKQIVNEILGPSGTWSNLNNEAINSLDLAIQYIAAVMGFNGANIFNPVVGGLPRTNMDAVFGALDVVLQVIDANVDWVKEAAGNDNWGFGALRNHILTNKGLIEIVDTVVDAINASIGDANFGLGALRAHILVNRGLIETVGNVAGLIYAALGHGTWGLGALYNYVNHIYYDADGDQPYPASVTDHSILAHIMSKTGVVANFDRAKDSLQALAEALAALVSGTGLFHEQADTAVDITAINASETNVFALATASTRYIVRSLRLKCADPGDNTITVRLYELVNDGLTEVDSFEITTANSGTYHSLMDMFGMAQLAGDSLKVTVRCDAGGPYGTTGQYSHAKTNV